MPTATSCGEMKRAWLLIDRCGFQPLHPALDAVSRSPGDRIFAGLDGLHVDRDLARHSHAVVAGAPRDFRRIGACDQRLCRDASGIDAGSAEGSALDHGNLHPGIDQARSQRRSGLSGADDDGVEFLHRQNHHGGRRIERRQFRRTSAALERWHGRAATCGGTPPRSPVRGSSGEGVRQLAAPKRLNRVLSRYSIEPNPTARRGGGTPEPTRGAPPCQPRIGCCEPKYKSSVALTLAAGRGPYA